MPASCRRISKFRPRIATISPERIARRVKARARGRPAADVSVRQRFYRSRAAADSGACRFLQDAQRAPQRLAGLLWQGLTRTPDAADARMPGEARPRQARDMVRTRLPRAGQRGAGRGAGRDSRASLRGAVADDAIRTGIACEPGICVASLAMTLTGSCSPACASR